MTRTADNGWTDEQGELAKAMWGDGLSATQIAKAIPGKSRSAVLGWLDRNDGKKIPRRRIKALPRPRQHNGAEVARRVARAKLKRTYVPPPAKVAKVELAREPRGPHVHMVDLHDGCCRWPVGAWLIGEGYLFCGAPVTEQPSGRPPVYCEWHRRIAYQPARREREVA